MDRLSRIQGLPGLIVACLFSGALSTVSSGLNSLAAVTLEDLIMINCAPNLSEYRKTVLSKILAVAYGAVCLALTFVAAELGGVLQAALALFGMIGGPQLGLFFLGMLYPCANKIGAYVGFFCGLLFSFWLGIGAQIYKTPVPLKPMSVAGCPVANLTANFTTMTSYITSTTTTAATTVFMEPTKDPAHLDFYGISYIWYGALASGMVVMVGLIVSMVSNVYLSNESPEIDPRLVVPIGDMFCCCLPASVRRKLQCNVDHSQRGEEDVDMVTVVEPYETKAVNGVSGGYANPAMSTYDEGPRLREKGSALQNDRDNAMSLTRC